MPNETNLGTDPIGKLIARFSIPMIIAMLVNAVYNIVDRIFIGNSVGEFALAGLTITFPIMMIIFAFVSLIAVGGASLLAIKLGENDPKGASHVFSNTIGIGIVLNIIVLTLVFIFLTPLLNLFGSTSDSIGFATEYMRIILLGFIFQILSFVLMNFVRAEGKPLLAMISMLSSAIINIILDYIFIVVLDMGVTGAALGTISAQFIGFLILLSFYARGKSNLKFTFRNAIPDPKITIEIITIGFASFFSVVGTSIAMAIINNQLGDLGGTVAISSMGAINSLFTFVLMPLMGITSGIQPIIGFNHGAGNKDRVRKTIIYGIISGIVFSLVIFSILFSFSDNLVSLFLNSDNTISIASNGLRIYILLLPLLSIYLMGIAYFQSIQKGRTSMILGMLRQFIILTPLLLILPRIWDINGVWMSVPIADGISIIIVAVFLIRDLYPSRKKKQNYNIHKKGEIK